MKHYYCLDRSTTIVFFAVLFTSVGGFRSISRSRHQLADLNIHQPISFLHISSSNIGRFDDKNYLRNKTILCTSPTADTFSPIETWCLESFQQVYGQALTIKCPFFRRRAADLLDGIDMLMRFLIIRHKSLDYPFQPLGWRCVEDSSSKCIDLSIVELHETIRNDWCCSTHKGYYITGRLNTTVYRDDCEFHGPDPDMPVRGLRKYLNAVSQLFEQRSSRAELVSLEVVNEDKIVARWRLKGVLRLPWRPTVPEWTGKTTYHTDSHGLVYKHEEEWDISVFQAFLQTLWPDLAAKIWR
jgi:hypothetical protein